MTTPTTQDAVTLLAVCPTCSEVRYRSKFPIISATQCRPESFAPVDGAPELDPATPAPLCHICGALLAFTSEERLMAGGATAQARPAPDTSDVEVLFAAEKGETIRDIRDVPGGVVVISDRRIVRVAL